LSPILEPRVGGHRKATNERPWMPGVERNEPPAPRPSLRGLAALDPGHRSLSMPAFRGLAALDPGHSLGLSFDANLSRKSLTAPYSTTSSQWKPADCPSMERAAPIPLGNASIRAGPRRRPV